jgi:hypothetical protein
MEPTPTPTTPLPGSVPAPVPPPAAAGRPSQVITGVTPPQLGEALIRECRPTVAAHAGPAKVAHMLIRSIILAPLGWLLLGLPFALKFAPFVSRRYTLTNRRLMVRRGLKGTPAESIDLRDIDEVRLVPGSEDAFYLSATLEVLGEGKVRLTLPAVPEPQGFRQAILNACAAWVPGKGKMLTPFLPASNGAKT